MSIPYWAMYYLYANGSNPPTAADFRTIKDGPPSTHCRASPSVLLQALKSLLTNLLVEVFVAR
jgi:hypothetical protein